MSSSRVSSRAWPFVRVEDHRAGSAESRDGEARFLENVANRALVWCTKNRGRGILPNLVCDNKPTGQIAQSRNASEYGGLPAPGRPNSAVTPCVGRQAGIECEAAEGASIRDNND